MAVLSSPEVVDVNRSRENLFFSDDPSFCSSGGYVPRGLRDATVVPPITSSPPWVILRLATGETPEESPGENCPLFRAFRADGRDGRSGECIREEQESRAHCSRNYRVVPLLRLKLSRNGFLSKHAKRGTRSRWGVSDSSAASLSSLPALGDTAVTVAAENTVGQMLRGWGLRQSINCQRPLAEELADRNYDFLAHSDERLCE